MSEAAAGYYVSWDYTDFILLCECMRCYTRLQLFIKTLEFGEMYNEVTENNEQKSHGKQNIYIKKVERNWWKNELLMAYSLYTIFHAFAHFRSALEESNLQQTLFK